MIEDIRNLFEHEEEENYHKPVQTMRQVECDGRIGEQGFYTPKFQKFYVDFESRC